MKNNLIELSNILTLPFAITQSTNQNQIKELEEYSKVFNLCIDLFIEKATDEQKILLINALDDSFKLDYNDFGEEFNIKINNEFQKKECIKEIKKIFKYEDIKESVNDKRYFYKSKYFGPYIIKDIIETKNKINNEIEKMSNEKEKGFNWHKLLIGLGIGFSCAFFVVVTAGAGAVVIGAGGAAAAGVAAGAATGTIAISASSAIVAGAIAAIAVAILAGEYTSIYSTIDRAVNDFNRLKWELDKDSALKNGLKSLDGHNWYHSSWETLPNSVIEEFLKHIKEITRPETDLSKYIMSQLTDESFGLLHNKLNEHIDSIAKNLNIQKPKPSKILEDLSSFWKSLTTFDSTFSTKKIDDSNKVKVFENEFKKLDFCLMLILMLNELEMSKEIDVLQRKFVFIARFTIGNMLNMLEDNKKTNTIIKFLNRLNDMLSRNNVYGLQSWYSPSY